MSVPTQIGRYRIESRLGAGGFAVVWLAHDESLDTKIAIKVLADNWAGEADLRARFLAEARMLRRAASNRVVQVFDIGELEDGRPYFVMQYADRGTLSGRLRENGPLPLVQALRLTAEVARGVADLHRAGIVHRDLKPSNVLITAGPDGQDRLLVADLGVAKSMAHGSNVTMSVGSIGYMAPEQAVPSKGVDVRADVYSLGAMASNLITGKAPGLAGYTAPLLQSYPELPEPVCELLVQALQPQAENRWPDAASFAVRLEELARQFSAVPVPARAVAALEQAEPAGPTRQVAGRPPMPEGGRTTPGPSAAPPVPRPRSSRLRLVLIAAGVVIVMAGTGMVATHEITAARERALDRQARSNPEPSVSVSGVVPVSSPKKGAVKPTESSKNTAISGSMKPEGEWNYVILTEVTQKSITFDLVDYFAGAAAIKACKEDGVAVAVAGWCHDYYWRNKSPLLRTRGLNSDADVHYYTEHNVKAKLDPELITKLVGLGKVGNKGGGESLFKLTEHNDSIDQLEELIRE